MKVALVVGHTKKSPGACNKLYGICEFKFNNWLVTEVAAKIFDRCEVVIVYRDTYKDLPGKINKLNPDFVICFHNNAFNTKVSGSETLYYHKSKKGKKMASIFQKEITSILQLKDRGIKGKSSEERGGYILKYTNAPCIILEPFFIDNDTDYKIVVSKSNALIEACINSVYKIIDTV